MLIILSTAGPAYSFDPKVVNHTLFVVLRLLLLQEVVATQWDARTLPGLGCAEVVVKPSVFSRDLWHHTCGTMLEWSPNTPLGVLTPDTWEVVFIPQQWDTGSFDGSKTKQTKQCEFLVLFSSQRYFAYCIATAKYIKAFCTPLLMWCLRWLQVSNPTVDHKSRIQHGGFTWPSAVHALKITKITSKPNPFI